MSVDQAAFAEFREALKAPPAAFDDGLSDAERVARAAATFTARLDRRVAVDLDTCIHCGMCAEACHFYMATQDERYAPTYKFEPLRRFYRREMSPMRMLYRPFTRKVGIDDLRAWNWVGIGRVRARWHEICGRASTGENEELTTASCY